MSPLTSDGVCPLLMTGNLLSISNSQSSMKAKGSAAANHYYPAVYCINAMVHMNGGIGRLNLGILLESIWNS